MSFTIQLGYNSSEKEKLSKSVTYKYSLTGTLRDRCSITNPVILIESTDNLATINYASIDEFKRKYFVTDIVSVSHNLWELSLHCDVLSSFESSIRNNTGIISKQENKWNLYVDDGSFKVYQNPNVFTQTFPNGFSSSNFILTVSGG